MKIINIGILAHVDAGKTTLTESLLYTSGAIAEQGNVDKGTTRTDTMILERQRGITIQTAVTSFYWNDYKINIVIAEEPCVLYARRRLKKAAAQVAYVAEQGADAQRCLEELACPAFYRNGEDVAVDENLCTGCMVCLQVAPKAFKARKRA